VVTITRGYIPLHALDAAYMVQPGTGYIRLNKFAETTYREFMESLEALQKQGMTSLVLDLRDNGGGILSEAVEMADEFLDGDKLIVYTEGKHNPRKEYKCKRKGLFETGKLVVLIDEGSASATEVLTGALQDWGRATVIGRRSFGKGLVQEQYDLQDGAGLRLTIARYYTPLGRSIQKPYDKGFDNYDAEIMSRYHNGQLTHADSVPSNNGKKYTTADGKTVYGGGGITPDVFVPLDTSSYDSTLSNLYRRNTLGNFIYRYYMAHQSSFTAYKDASNFYKNYQPGDDMVRDLVEFARKDSVSITMPEGKSKENLETRLKSLMARQIWRNEGYYEVVNPRDPVMKKALEAVGK
jgi:carboxyl-terminal processing protease